MPGADLNDSAFRRKIDELDLIEPLDGQKSKATARPAQLFRLTDETLRAFDRHIQKWPLPANGKQKRPGLPPGRSGQWTGIRTPT